MKELRYSTHAVTEEDIAAVTAVLRSDWLTCGPEVERFEASLCEYTGAKYAVAVNSGTAALYLAYGAASRKGRRGRILTSPLTFVATANAALLAGLDAMFCDVEPATGNVDLPDYRDCISVPVHFAGRAAPICGGVVVEDACHALGAMDFDGCSRVGSCAHSLAACFSFHPVKPICTGEGGAVTTNDQGFADEVRLLRSHGRVNSHGRDNGLMVALSGNYRIPDINAALGLEQLKRCDSGRERRAELALEYRGLGPVEGVEYPLLHSWCQGVSHDGIVHPSGPMESMDAWHLYPIRIKHGRRDEVKAKLNAQGIMAQVHYSPIVPLQPYYRERFGYEPGCFPEAEAWAAEELSLPLYSQMTEADVERVVDALREALA